MRLLHSLLLSTLVWGCTPSPVEEAGGSGAVRVGQVLGGGHEDEGFDRAEVIREFVFPDDHGAHPSFKTEWWYLTANLRGENEEEFGVQFTLFRHALSRLPQGKSAWQSGQIYMAHIALTDVNGKRHWHDQRLSRGHPESAGVEIAPKFRAFLENWELSGEVADPVSLNLTANSARGFRMQLRLRQTQPILLQGDQGLSAKGAGQASYYYSFPSMAVTGEVGMDEQVYTVQGKAWLDREWSTSVLNDAQSGWDWFALHFDDGAEATLFNLRRHDCSLDPYNQALHLDANGARTDYEAEEFSLRPLRFWMDEDGTSWPVSWNLRLANASYELKALVDDQVMDTGIRYWEGAVGVFKDSVRIGSGYMELTGYEGDAVCEG